MRGSRSLPTMWWMIPHSLTRPVKRVTPVDALRIGHGCSHVAVPAQPAAAGYRYVDLGGGRIGYQVSGYDPGQQLVIDPTLVYSTFVGGTQDEVVPSPYPGTVRMAVDSGGNAYVTGLTYSADFPVSPGAFDTSYNGKADAFVTKFCQPACQAPAEDRPVI